MEINPILLRSNKNKSMRDNMDYNSRLQKEMEELRHKNIMEEIKALKEADIKYFNR